MIKRLTSFLLVITLLFMLTPQVTAESIISDVLTTEEEIEANFPETYVHKLLELKELHPNWNFVAFNTGLKWEDCLTEESELYPSRNLAYAWIGEQLYFPTSWYSTTISGAYNWAANAWTKYDSGNWYQASEEAIAYCMDPRNFMTESQIFQFMDSAAPLDEELAAQAIEHIFGDSEESFWNKSGEDSDLYYEDEYGEKIYLTYAEAIAKLGTEIGANQIVIASRLKQEQGITGTDMILGDIPFSLSSGEIIYDSYYNYFNIGATGDSVNDILRNGLRTAYQYGWDTRYKALKGGIEKYLELFVYRGQTTLYSQKFNVDSSSSRLFWGQYMQNITAPQTECLTVYNAMVEADALDADLTFIIPVFSDMPETVDEPIKDGNPNYKLGSIYMNGESIEGFSADKEEYTFEVDSELNMVHFNIKAYAQTTKIDFNSIVSLGSFADDVRLEFGENIIDITCTAENGDTKIYKIIITRPGGPQPNEQKIGDLNDDGEWDIFDASIIYSYILGNTTLDSIQFEIADINRDGDVDVFDAAIIYQYILGYISEIPQSAPETQEEIVQIESDI